MLRWRANERRRHDGYTTGLRGRSPWSTSRSAEQTAKHYQQIVEDSSAPLAFVRFWPMSRWGYPVIGGTRASFGTTAKERSDDGERRDAAGLEAAL